MANRKTFNSSALAAWYRSFEKKAKVLGIAKTTANKLKKLFDTKSGKVDIEKFEVMFKSLKIDVDDLKKEIDNEWGSFVRHIKED